jgi:hypothetical protein
MPSMPLKAYARSRHADPKSIRRAIAAGLTQRDAEGLIDPEQADSAWASTRRASRMGQHGQDDAGTRSAKATIAVTRAKLRLLKQRLDIMRERYVDQADAVAVGEREAVYVVEALQAACAMKARIVIVADTEAQAAGRDHGGFGGTARRSAAGAHGDHRRGKL